jgi:hypothetical protein
MPKVKLLQTLKVRPMGEGHARPKKAGWVGIVDERELSRLRFALEIIEEPKPPKVEKPEPVKKVVEPEPVKEPEPEPKKDPPNVVNKPVTNSTKKKKG